MNKIFTGLLIALAGAAMASRTPYPILFVHGLGSSSKVWGANLADGYTLSVPGSNTCPSGYVQIGSSHVTSGGQGQMCISTPPPPVTGPVPPGTIIVNTPLNRTCGHTVGGAPGSTSICYSASSTRSDNVSSYDAGSTAAHFATHFGGGNPTDNGIYFYNSRKKLDALGTNWEMAPFAPLDEICLSLNGGGQACGQTAQLYGRIVEVLDHYYGTNAWKSDPNAKLAIVAHSQGGLITRNLFRIYTGTGLDNPVNHITRIVTIGTPHRGADWAEGKPTNGAVRAAKARILDKFDLLERISKIPFVDFLDGIVKKGNNLLASQEWLDGTIPGGFIQTLNASAYPMNRVTGKSVPIIALYGLAPGVTAKWEEALWHEAAILASAAAVAHSEASRATDPVQRNLLTSKASDLTSAYAIVIKHADILRDLGNTWNPVSDFVVHQNSQRMLGLYPGAPIYEHHIQPGKIVPHMKLSDGIAETDQKEAILAAVLMELEGSSGGAAPLTKSQAAIPSIVTMIVQRDL